MTISPEALEAIGAEHEAHEREIASLKRQRDGLVAKNAVLQAELNGLQLRLSVADGERELAELAKGQLLLRVRKLEEAWDRMAQKVTALIGNDSPHRTEFERLKSDYYSHSARSSC